MIDPYRKGLLTRSPLLLLHAMLWTSFGACIALALFFDLRRWIG